jgi:hypothetical protein
MMLYVLVAVGTGFITGCLVTLVVFSVCIASGKRNRDLVERGEDDEQDRAR